MPSVVTGNNGVVGAIVDLDGPATPDNYTITVENGARVGTVYRRITPVPEMPDAIVAPTGLTNRGTVLVGSKKSQALPGGQYASVSGGNNSTITLGTAGATVPDVYYFENLSLGNGVNVKLVGPVIVYLKAPITIQNNVVMGNVSNPAWLQIKVIEADSEDSDIFEVGNNGTLYAQVLAPDSQVRFSNNSTFNGGVTADYLDLVNNGLGVVFSLPPVFE